MISKVIEAALTERKDRSASSAEKVESSEASLSLGVLFPSKSKMVNRAQNRGLYLAEEEDRMLNIREGIVKGVNPGSFGMHVDGEEHGKQVIVDVAD